VARRRNAIQLNPPYLKRIWLDYESLENETSYPFSLNIFRKDFELTFEKTITIIVGENGVGKSTLLEAIAALIGFNADGGGVGYGAVRDSSAVDRNGDALLPHLRASWLPMVKKGWFFRAETFFSVARYLDSVGSNNSDFLSHSHGEGFLRFFEERCVHQGVYIFDEPEAALSPTRQMEFLKLLKHIEETGNAQIIIATHSPFLMAYPNANILEISRAGINPVTLEQTDHFRLMREFSINPKAYVEAMIDD
jgi:predicted ATPase